MTGPRASLFHHLGCPALTGTLAMLAAMAVSAAFLAELVSYARRR